MASAVHTRELDTPADIHDVWRIVTDTDRMGRALGFDKIEVRPLEGAGAARHLIATKIAGLVVEYEEQPFEWVEPSRFSCRRVCRKGPLRSMSTTWELTPAPGGAGTHGRFTVELEPSRAVLMPIAKVAAQKSVASQLRAVSEAVERLAHGQPLYLLPPLHAVTGHALDRAAAGLRALAGERLAPLADRLVALVREGADPDVGRLRPFELAHRWNVDRRDVVTVCLHGVSAGLLDLVWDLVCPSCRTASERLAALSDAGTEGHCQLCELSFGVEREQAIEATFRPAPAVRVVEDAPLCISGPARTPHVLAQKILAPGEDALLPAPAEPGRYRVFVRGGATATVDVEAGGPREARFDAAAGAGTALHPLQAPVAPGGEVHVRRPEGASEVHVKLERAEWASLATTAHFVSTLPAFRRQFGSQVLRPGLSLKVARATILFSDLTASTALYAREGDAVAFKLVQDHFDVLGAAVEASRGAIVKTIGDAIMAVFEDEADGVRGAIAMLRAFEAFRAGSELARRREVHLKVGLSAGACYVVTANKMLDYFGQSVNIAARLQALAAAGEAVVPAGLADVAVAAGWLEHARVREKFSTPIKGLDGEVDAARLALRVVP
jgi:class 3 adenylate cyclase